MVVATDVATAATAASTAALAAGFVLGASLIFSIGPQNMRLIRAGVVGRHATSVATAGYLSEIVIVLAGVFGLGALLSEATGLADGLRLLGVAFLLWCALQAWRSSTGAAGWGDDEAGEASRAAALRAILSATWLNPMVYVEVMLLVGVLASNFGGAGRGWFAAGFLFASAFRFYGWCWVGHRLSPILARPGRRRSFDRLSGLLLLLAAGLLSLQIASC
jgi:L-lysine exporter family protein LysE/ArgO